MPLVLYVYDSFFGRNEFIEIQSCMFSYVCANNPQLRFNFIPFHWPLAISLSPQPLLLYLV